jgi:hypothetical protein
MFQRQLQGLKGESGPYDTMLEVLNIYLDDASFNYAATMLKNFRWSEYAFSITLVI